MKKNIRLLFLFCIFLFGLCIQLSTTANAQVDKSVCDAKGFGTAGCLKCTASDPNNDPLNCNLEGQGVSAGVACGAGASAPAASSCSAITDYGECITKYVACVPQAAKSYCKFDDPNNSNGPRSCIPCGPGTTTPTCPAGATDSATCTQNCVVASGNFTCIPSGGSCKTACGTTELKLSGATCQTGVCCRLANANAFPVTQFQGSCGAAATPGIDTAIGCIPIGDINAFAAFFLKWGLGVAGGIGFLFLIYASFQIMTSQGDPKRLQTGRELLMSAVSGIILLVFSVFVFKVLGVNILGIF